MPEDREGTGGDTEQGWREHGGDMGGHGGDRGRMWRGQRGDMGGCAGDGEGTWGDTEQGWSGLGGDEVGIERGHGTGTEETCRDTRGHVGTQGDTGSSHQEQGEDPPAEGAAGAGGVQDIGGGDTSRGHPELTPQQPQLHVGDAGLGLRGHTGDTQRTR